ncbi:major facilitator superfamily transporter [Penicillium expansum]|nr:major facilitator superfamily transporter [Penicillium expansum]
MATSLPAPLPPCSPRWHGASSAFCWHSKSSLPVTGVAALVLFNFVNQGPVYAWLTLIVIVGIFISVIVGKMVLHSLISLGVLRISMSVFLTGGTIFITKPIYQIYWAQIVVGIVVPHPPLGYGHPLAGPLVNTFVDDSIYLGLKLTGTVDPRVNDGRNGAV